MTNKRIIVDIDETICDLFPELNCICNDATGAALSRKDWVQYDVYTLYGLTQEDFNKLCIKQKILEIAQPLVKGRATLDVLVHQDFEIIYLTARAWYPKAEKVTKNWLNHWSFPKGDIHVIPLDMPKADYIKKEIDKPINIIVDDNPKHTEDFVKNKSASKIFLIDRPWNAQYKNLDPYRISNISEILKHL